MGHSAMAVDLIILFRPSGGEGGIRTHGAANRTTVFEFYDSHAGVCRAVAKRALWFTNFAVTVSAYDP